MKIRAFSLLKYMGWKYCLFVDHFGIEKYWGGRIIDIGFAIFSVSFDFRKNWIKDMITGKIE